MPWGYNEKGQYGWIDEPGQPNPITGEVTQAPVQDTEGGLRNSAAAYAQQREGYVPRRVMQEGQVTYQNGKPGVMIKYDTPNGSSTEWTPLPEGWSGGSNIDPFEFGMSPGSGGGGGGGGGSMDPWYNQFASLVKAQGAADLTNTRAAIQKALIGFGYLPGNYDDKLNAVDDVTKDLVKKNTESGISYYARMMDQKRDSLQNLIRRMSSSGLRRSGAKGAKMRKHQLDFDRQWQDSLSEILGQLGSAYNQYATNEGNRQMQLLQAMQNSQYYGSPNYNNSGNAQPNSYSAPFTPAWQGTWAEGIDTGGYVPGSGVVTDFGNPTQIYYGPNGTGLGRY